MNILIVEDDALLASHISQVFSCNNRVNRINIISSSLDFAKQFDSVSGYDIILTDLALGAYSDGLRGGYKVIEAVRSKGLNIPIIVISGKGDIHILREAFSLGATDYIIKPFRLKELEVRVNHWFKNYCFGDHNTQGVDGNNRGLLYDQQKNEFFFNEIYIPLSRSQKYLFLLFFLNQGKLLTSNFLREKIWGDYEENIIERNLRISILRLRRSLQKYNLSKNIRTIRGEGYLFEV